MRSVGNRVMSAGAVKVPEKESSLKGKENKEDEARSTLHQVRTYVARSNFSRSALQGGGVTTDVAHCSLAHSALQGGGARTRRVVKLAKGETEGATGANANPSPYP